MVFMLDVPSSAAKHLANQDRGHTERCEGDDRHHYDGDEVGARQIDGRTLPQVFS